MKRREVRDDAEKRWRAERYAARDHLPRQRILLAEYAALPAINPMNGKPWRAADEYGRLLLIRPDDEVPWIGLKIVPILRVPSRTLAELGRTA